MPEPDNKPIGDVHSDMAEQTDRILYDILVNGEEKAVPTGDGGVEKVRVTPSAAMLNVIRNRLKDLGIQSPMGKGRASDALRDEARRRLRFPGGGMPPISDEEDAATA